MDRWTSDRQAERQPRLSEEQRTEIGDILLSARGISRQLINRANEQAARIVTDAREEAERLLAEAREEEERILREAEEKAAAIVREAEERSAAPAASAASAEMQEYIVRCVGDCFSRLRQQQLDMAESINEQWRGFLSGLPLADETPPIALPPAAEVSQADIEARVNAIAKELMDIIGK